MQVSRIVSKRAFNESTVVFITTFLQQCTLKQHMVNDHCLTTMVTTSWQSSGQDMGFGGLGTVGHGRNAPPSVRKKACPAFQHSCKHCGRCSHFDDLCRSKDHPRRLPAHNTKTDQVNTAEDCEALSLMPCVPYRPLVSTKAAARSSLTTMCMTICVIGGFCRHPDHNLSSISVFQYHRRTTRILALNLHATSSQSHYWPWLILLVRAAWWAWRLSVSWVSKQRTSSQFPWKCMLPTTTASKYLVLSYFDSLVNQLLAITWNLGRSPTSQMPMTKLFLSHEACISLGKISAQFPQIGEAIGTHHVGSLEEDDLNLQPPISHIMKAAPAPAPCGCPKRTQPPPTPAELPYPATEAKRGRLQEFLLDYY